MLTDEYIEGLRQECNGASYLTFARAIESAVLAKLREQNEPIAEVISNNRAGMYDELPIGTLLYTNPAPIPEVEAKYNELIMAVGRKFKGESRHATALKYIRQMEEPFDTVKRANAMLMCLCQEAADALEAQAAELLSQQEKLCSYIIELGRTRELCNMLGEALVITQAYLPLDKVPKAAEALTAWREAKCS